MESIHERSGMAMFTNTRAFSGFAVGDLQAAQKFYGDVLGINTSERNGLLKRCIWRAAGTRSSTPSRPATSRRTTRS